MQWPLLNLVLRRAVARELGSLPSSWPTPAHRLLEGVPIPSSDLLPAIRCRKVTVKPAVEQLVGDSVRFSDRTEEPFDRIIYATGYRISLPFLPRSLISPNGRELPLFRRIVPPSSLACSSPASLTPPAGCCRWLRHRATGSPPSSTVASRFPQQGTCGRRSSEPSAAAASAFRTRARTASVAMHTPTGGSCVPTCAKRGGGPRE